MDIFAIREQAFREIQADPVLWKQWNEALSEYARQVMLSERIYYIGLDEGLSNPGNYGV